MTHFELIPLFEPNPESIQLYEADHLLPFGWKIQFVSGQWLVGESLLDLNGRRNLPILVKVEFILIEKWMTVYNIEYS